MALSRLTSNSFAPSNSSPLNGMKNILINGDFRVWQKGTDLNTLVTGNGITGVDRWTNQYCDFTARLRKVEDTIDGETVDTVEITKTGGTYSSCEFTQKVEVNVAKYLRGQTVTFSFWVKKVGSTFGAHRCSYWIGDSETVDDTGWTNSRTYDRGRATNSNVVFTNNTWQKITVTRTLSADTNTIYCTLYSETTPLNEGIRIAKCQLEIGSRATDFERRPIALEETLCGRYFLDLGNVQFNAWNHNIADTGGTRIQAYALPVVMRAEPSLTYQDNVGNSQRLFAEYPNSTNGNNITFSFSSNGKSITGFKYPYGNLYGSNGASCLLIAYNLRLNAEF